MTEFEAEYRKTRLAWISIVLILLTFASCVTASDYIAIHSHCSRT